MPTLARVDAPTYAAIDLGASSARTFTGCLRDGATSCANVTGAQPPGRAPGRAALEPAAPVRRGARALGAGPLHGVGVDGWGVDYALLDERRRVLGLPFHYRDERRRE